MIDMEHPNFLDCFGLHLSFFIPTKEIPELNSEKGYVHAYGKHGIY